MKIYGIDMNVTAFKKGTKEKFSDVNVKGKRVIFNNEILGDIKDFDLKPVITYLGGHDVYIGSVVEYRGIFCVMGRFSMGARSVFLKPISGERGFTCPIGELYSCSFAGVSIEEYNDNTFHTYDGSARIIGNGLVYNPNYQSDAF